MRKIIVITFVSLDGVMQAPGGPEEDESGVFEYGGWMAPYHDEVSAEQMRKQMEPAEYLLGRTTFEIWEEYWPKHPDVWPGINSGTKYVLSATRKASDWTHTIFLNSIADIKKVKNSPGRDLQVWGSSKLVQLLLQNDLVDELWLKISPVTLGKGKRLLGDGAIPAAFRLVESCVTPSGIIFANYARAGKIVTGTVGAKV